MITVISLLSCSSCCFPHFPLPKAIHIFMFFWHLAHSPPVIKCPLGPLLLWFPPTPHILICALAQIDIHLKACISLKPCKWLYLGKSKIQVPYNGLGVCSVASVASDIGCKRYAILPSSKDAGVGCHALLQRIFLTQGLNSHLLCLLCRWVLDHKHHPRSPLQWPKEH